jgi:hypothetical protein
MAALSNEVYDCLAIFAALEVFEAEVGQFSPPEPASEQNRNDCSVILPLSVSASGIATMRGLQSLTTNCPIVHRVS